MKRILIVDDEPGLRSFMQAALRADDREIVTASDGLEAKQQLGKRAFHLLITDLKMPRMDGMSLLRHARETAPEMEVLVLTAHGSVETAVGAMKLGALDYLTKPLSGPAELRLVVERALERRRLKDLTQGHRQQRESQELVTADAGMQALLGQLDRVAVTDSTVLLSGESGTGKELAAQRLHQHSPRREGPFVAINCAAVNPTLVESEMFGHEKGAFTGAHARHRGRFELADGGTLFLDEIGELPLVLQAKLLRVIESRRFERVGGTQTIEVDLRLVAATNRDLLAEVQAQRFRQDLYHRLAVFPLRLPPLRERPADIEALAVHLLASAAARLGRTLELPPETLSRLRQHRWPGNVRELANVIERAVILCDGPRVLPEHLLLTPETAGESELDGTLKQIERRAIARALRHHDGHRQKAAEALGISVRGLYGKIKEYGIES